MFSLEREKFSFWTHPIFHCFLLKRCTPFFNLRGYLLSLLDKHVSYLTSGTRLLRLQIPNSVTLIGTEAFKDCESLRDVTLPKTSLEASSSILDTLADLVDVSSPSLAWDGVKQHSRDG